MNAENWRIEYIKKLQESQYNRPYHHLVDFKDLKTYDFLDWGLEYYGYVSFILDLVKKINPKEIADVGCGDGKVSIELAKLLPQSNIEGYDLSKQAIAFAKAYGMNLPNVKFYDIDFKNSKKKYDLCLAIEVLEHIPDSDVYHFLKIINDKPKDSGYLIISVPTKNVPLHKKHYRHYDEELLKSQIADLFEIKKIYYIHKGNSLLYKSIKRVLINPIFILNLKILRKLIFNVYNKYCLKANELTGTHLVAVLIKS